MMELSNVSLALLVICLTKEIVMRTQELTIVKKCSALEEEPYYAKFATLTTLWVLIIYATNTRRIALNLISKEFQLSSHVLFVQVDIILKLQGQT